MEKQKTSKREWVKTFAIIFLVILLILTFFSNTIMNRSLPEVATQQVSSGTINAKIRGTGTVSANETYDVTINQTRKIRSVLVKVGDKVNAGDTLFTLESMESDELKAAQQALSDMELAYQKSLIEASNSSSTENRDIQKLRDAYNEALATYRLYSTADPSQLTAALEEAKIRLTDLKRIQEDANDKLTEINNEYTQAQQEAADATSRIAALEKEIEGYQAQSDALTLAFDDFVRHKYIHEENYSRLADYAKEIYKRSDEYSVKIGMAAFAEDTALLERSIREAISQGNLTEDDDVSSDLTEGGLKALSEAYRVLTDDMNAVCASLDDAPNLDSEINIDEIYRTLNTRKDNQLTTISQNIRIANDEISALSSTTTALDRLERDVEWQKAEVKDATRAAEDQQALVDKYTQASSAAETLKAAEEALEDKVFTVNLGDSGSLDLKAAKEAIEDKKKEIEELTQNADGQDVTAKVSGTVSAINITAGNTAGAETALATITVADRGYTVNIAVTNEQARQVKIGDEASIANYWYGDLKATLESIANDPQNLGKGKLLVFRLSGDDVEAGSNMTLSIGQRSANYDAIVPNSALRSDANGDFVLVVTSKSSPLGNRYVATRADVQKLASDDTTTAVSGLVSGDFVITTSTKPIEAGDQVRLVDNG